MCECELGMADQEMTDQENAGRRWRSLLRAADQTTVAALVVLALVGMGVYWLVQGGATGGLVEIDRATPLVARFQVDVNAATWPELAQLPQIGETLARRIVESREKGGRFADYSDLLRVNGIGPRTLERMTPFLLPMPGQEQVAGEALGKIPVQ
jgi:competence protein ComEA